MCALLTRLGAFLLPLCLVVLGLIIFLPSCVGRGLREDGPRRGLRQEKTEGSFGDGPEGGDPELGEGGPILRRLSGPPGPADGGGLLPLGMDGAGITWGGRPERGANGQRELTWTGDRLSFGFCGVRVCLGLKASHGQAFLDLEVDGRVQIIRPGKKETFFCLEGLAPDAPHRLSLVKRSEASVGRVLVSSISLEGWLDNSAVAPRPRILFVGDSISAGACDEDGELDQWLNFSSHNGQKAYPMVLARALGADAAVIAVSGIGLCQGYYPTVMGKVWKRAYPNPKAPMAKDLGPEPDLIVLNLGENDSSSARAGFKAFPAQRYAEAYRAMVGDLRLHYPKARILCALGGMERGATDSVMGKAWADLTQSLMAEDANIKAYKIIHYTRQHPRVADHAIIAEELVSYISSLGDWAFGAKAP